MIFTLSSGLQFEYEPKRLSPAVIAQVAEMVAQVAPHTRQGNNKPPVTLASIAAKFGTTERTVKRVRRRMVEQCAITRAA